MAHFQELPTEILTQIFEYCDPIDLCRMQQTCKRFYEIIGDSAALGKYLLVTNQLQKQMRDRSIELLSFSEKVRILKNWENGLYREYCTLDNYKRYIPWLVLTKDHLWISRGSCIRAYKRTTHSINENRICYSMRRPYMSDVFKFTIKQNYVVSGHQDGYVLIWDPKKEKYLYQNCHESDINTIDFENHVFATGSRDRTVKVWQLYTEPRHSCKLLCNYNMNDRVWSVALSKRNQYLATGAAGYHSLSPLSIFDINRWKIIHQLGDNRYRGYGILHIKWESPNILLTSGYDKTLRKWDIRTGSCEQAWEDPFFSTIYCFDTDGHYSLIAGTQTNGRVVLWDTRKKSYVQVYFMNYCRNKQFSSPVYSLGFDASNLFTATDRCLHVLDFSIKQGTPRNYSNIFRN